MSEPEQQEAEQKSSLILILELKSVKLLSLDCLGFSHCLTLLSAG